MSITSKITRVSLNGCETWEPYIIYPVGFKNRKPYGKGVILVSVYRGGVESLLEAMINKYDLPFSLYYNEVAWYLTSKKMERLVKRFGKAYSKRI